MTLTVIDNEVAQDFLGVDLEQVPVCCVPGCGRQADLIMTQWCLCQTLWCLHCRDLRKAYVESFVFQFFRKGFICHLCGSENDSAVWSELVLKEIPL